MKKVFLALFIVAGITGYYSCTKDKAKQPVIPTNYCIGFDSVTITYNNQIKSIMDIYCAQSGCHDAAGCATCRNVFLDTYGNTVSAAGRSDFDCSILQSGSCIPMPNGGTRLDDSLIHQILCWKSRGYPQ